MFLLFLGIFHYIAVPFISRLVKFLVIKICDRIFKKQKKLDRQNKFSFAMDRVLKEKNHNTYLIYKEISDEIKDLEKELSDFTKIKDWCTSLLIVIIFNFLQDNSISYFLGESHKIIALNIFIFST